ncbi:hypothetical protein GO298_03008 [Ralstonia solanacearum]|nr:hypothetical protein [Ralstonia solanacearum]
MERAVRHAARSCLTAQSMLAQPVSAPCNSPYTICATPRSGKSRSAITSHTSLCACSVRSLPRPPLHQVILVDAAKLLACADRDATDYVLPLVQHWHAGKRNGIRDLLDPAQPNIPEMPLISFKRRKCRSFLGLMGLEREGGGVLPQWAAPRALPGIRGRDVLSGGNPRIRGGHAGPLLLHNRCAGRAVVAGVASHLLQPARTCASVVSSSNGSSTLGRCSCHACAPLTFTR